MSNTSALIQQLMSNVIANHKSNFKWRICETGAGCPVANAFLSNKDTSKSVYDTHSPGSKTAIEDAGYLLDEDDPITMRFCANVMARKSSNLNATALYISSFDIKEGEPSVGWIGISFRSYTRYYHITLPSDNGSRYPLTYVEAVRAIGNIGIILICIGLGEDIELPRFVDEIMDKDGKNIKLN